MMSHRKAGIVQVTRHVQPPTGLSRILFRVPIYSYRAGRERMLENRI